MNLLLLWPPIQEELLFLPKVNGKDIVRENVLWPAVDEYGWTTWWEMQYRIFISPQLYSGVQDRSRNLERLESG